MVSKYVDTPAIVQVIGNIYNNPDILDNEKYKFLEEDFPNDFHKNTYRAILRKYMFLMVLEQRIEYRPSYKLKKYYVQSDELERDLIDFENKWYDKNKKKVEEIINEY